MKDNLKNHIGIILLNAVRIWGCSWIGFLVMFIPMYIVRGISGNHQTEAVVSSIIGILATSVALFIMIFREKNSKQNINQHLLYSFIPPLIIALLIILSKSNYIISVSCNILASALQNEHRGTDYLTMGYISLSALVCFCMYAGSLLLGYIMGKKRLIVRKLRVEMYLKI